jgi:hypothetical protein
MTSSKERVVSASLAPQSRPRSFGQWERSARKLLGLVARVRDLQARRLRFAHLLSMSYCGFTRELRNAANALKQLIRKLTEAWRRGGLPRPAANRRCAQARPLPLLTNGMAKRPLRPGPFSLSRRSLGPSSRRPVKLPSASLARSMRRRTPTSSAVSKLKEPRALILERQAAVGYGRPNGPAARAS